MENPLVIGILLCFVGKVNLRDAAGTCRKVKNGKANWLNRWGLAPMIVFLRGVHSWLINIAKGSKLMPHFFAKVMWRSAIKELREIGVSGPNGMRCLF